MPFAAGSKVADRANGKGSGLDIKANDGNNVQYLSRIAFLGSNKARINEMVLVSRLMTNGTTCGIDEKGKPEN